MLISALPCGRLSVPTNVHDAEPDRRTLPSESQASYPQAVLETPLRGTPRDHYRRCQLYPLLTEVLVDSHTLLQRIREIPACHNTVPSPPAFMEVNDKGRGRPGGRRGEERESW